MVPVLAAIFAFIAVTSLAWSLFRGTTMASAVERRLKGLNEGPPDLRAAAAVGGMLRRDTSALPLLRSLSTNTWGDKSAVDLQRAGSNLRVSEYILLRIFCGFVLGVFVALVLRSSGVMILALPAAVIGYMLPRMYMGYRKGRRLSAINGQLVEMMQLVSNSLRSGFAFTQAIELAAKQLEPPIQDELNHLLHDNALGARPEDAMKDFAHRTGSYDVDMMVTTILVQRTTGGNLSEILDNVAETIRERERLQGEVRAMTASQRFTGLILSIYPIPLFLLFAVIAPDLMSELWTTTAGLVMLGAAVCLQILGMLTIRQILQLDV